MDISKYKKPEDRLFIIYPSVPFSIETVSHNVVLPVSTLHLSAEAAECPLDVESSDEVGTFKKRMFSKTRFKT